MARLFLKISNVSFVKSAGKIKDMPCDEVPEFLLIGRSNVGKSSLINFLLNRQNISYVSNKPGKTQLLNFFNCQIGNLALRIVDSPGFGYSQTSYLQKQKFEKIMLDYLSKRSNLVLIGFLLDLRHPSTKIDNVMINLLKNYNHSIIFIGTKLDKLKKNDVITNSLKFKNWLSFVNNAGFFLTSSKDKKGWPEIWNKVQEIILKFH